MNTFLAHTLVLTRVQTFIVQPPSSFHASFLYYAMQIRAFSVAMFLLVASVITPAFSAPIEYAVDICNLAIFTDLFVAFESLNRKITPEPRTSEVKSLASV